MRLAGEFSTRCFKTLLLAVFPVLLWVAPLTAQKPPSTSPPKYDLTTEAKMKGTVEELRLPPKGSEKEPAHLLVKSGT